VVRTHAGQAGVRSLLLLLDGPATSYVVGTIAILLSGRNQRVGDMVAGTIVARERTGGRPDEWTDALTGPDSLPDGLFSWDVSAVTDSDLATLRTFLHRRESLAPEARRRLAAELANRIGDRVVVTGEPLGAEAFIEAVVAVKSARR